MKQTYLPPTGNPNATIAVVSDQPTVYEIKTGKLNPPGLNDCLTMAKIPKLELYITNVVKDLDENAEHVLLGEGTRLPIALGKDEEGNAIQITGQRLKASTRKVGQSGNPARDRFSRSPFPTVRAES